MTDAQKLILAIVVAGVVGLFGFWFGSERAQSRVLVECKGDGGFRLYVNGKEFFYYCGYTPQ